MSPNKAAFLIKFQSLAADYTIDIIHKQGRIMIYNRVTNEEYLNMPDNLYLDRAIESELGECNGS